MKNIIYFILMIACSYCISEEREYGKSFDLGYGFVEKHYSVQNPPGLWQGTFDYKTIFFNERDLGDLSRFRISPSGKHAIYRKAEEGKLYIFDVTQQKEESVLLRKYCSLNKLRWNEKEYKLLIGCYGLNDSYYNIQIDLKHNTVFNTRLKFADSHFLARN